MALGASGDGEFISKYDSDVTENDGKSKRSLKDNAEETNQRKALLPVKVTKRSKSKQKKAQKRDKTATTGTARAPQELGEVLITSSSSLYG